MTSLLPPNATPVERRLTIAAADLQNAQAPIETLWDADAMPAHMLPWLAWSVDVDQWSRHWPESVKRAAINEAIPIRRLRGTTWAVRRALEVLGYSAVEILEHAVQHKKWLAAGGLELSGAWPLDGRALEVVGAPRVVTTNWAEYALAFNISDAPFTGRDQRRLRRRVENAAPLRSSLKTLVYRYATPWDAAIRLQPLQNTVRLTYTDCQGARVARAKSLMGCWSLSGEYVPRTLSESSSLRGAFSISGRRAVGESINQGWGSAVIRGRQLTRMGLQSRGTPPWTLGESTVDAINGAWALDEIIDASRAIGGGWPIGAAALHQVRRPRLNAARTLGDASTMAGAGTSARAVARQRRLMTEIHLDHGRPATTVPWRHWINRAAYTRLGAPIGVDLKRLAITLPAALGARSASRNTWALGDSLSLDIVNRIDARWKLNETIDGYRRIEGRWPLSISQLTQQRPVALSGARTLGASHSLPAIGSTLSAMHIDRRLAKEIRL